MVNATMRHSKLNQKSGTLAHLLPWVETTDHPDFPMPEDDAFSPCVAKFRSDWNLAAKINIGPLTPRKVGCC